MEKIKRAGPAWRRALRIALAATAGAVVLAVGGVAGVSFGSAEAYGIVMIERVSVSADGVQGNGYSGSHAISSDGRYVAFMSNASNLVAGDTNGWSDIFVRDTVLNTTTRVSVGAGGLQGNGDCYNPAISSDGRYVAFYTRATTLVVGDTNNQHDIFVHDRVANTTTRVSVGAADAQANDSSDSPAISSDGRYAAFRSMATNLVSGDTNSRSDVFVRDTVLKTTTRVSVGAGGTQANDVSQRPALSPDGRYVAFASGATNLVVGDTNNAPDVFVRDTKLNTTTLVSVGAGGVQGDGDSSDPVISSDGRYVVFTSNAANLVSADTNAMPDVFVRDRVANTTTRVSVGSGGAQGNADSYSPAICSDGRYVVFESRATNLVPGDTNNQDDIFVRDTKLNTTTRVSVDIGGVQGNGYNFSPAISADGRFVSFLSGSTNLVPGDTNSAHDVFRFSLYGVIENDAPGVTFGRFINGFSSAYSAGSYTYAYSKVPYAGSRLEARFKGNRVRWIGPKNPAYGMAKVYIDGVYKATVDCYSATGSVRATLWESALLTDAVHTISIEMASGKNPASSGFVVVIDRFEVEGAAPSGVGLRANETAGVFTGTWIKITGNPTYTGSSYAYSYWPPAKFNYTFTGTKCAWIGSKVYNYGRAAIYLDGVYRGAISQYAPASATSFRARVWESQTLPWGTHTLEIKPLGAKDAASAGTIIVVDAVDYMP